MAAHSHTHIQDEASATWTINHGLGQNPNVGVSVIEGGALTVIHPVNVAFPSVGQVVITFSSPRTGEARLT